MEQIVGTALTPQLGFGRVQVEPQRSNMTSSTTYHRANLRQELIDAAVRIMDADGIDALTLRRLADEAAVSRTAPYHHFENKEALLAAVASDGFDHLFGLLDTIPAGDESLDDDERRAAWRYQLASLANAYLEFARKNPSKYELMFSEPLWSNPDLHTFHRLGRQCYRRVNEVLAVAAPTRDVEPGPLEASGLAPILFSTFHGLATLTNAGFFVRVEDLAALSEDLARQFS